MSYTIIYKTMFVRTKENKFIPMCLAGSNNCYVTTFDWMGRKHERRERNWDTFNFGSNLILTESEIIESLDRFKEKYEKRASEYATKPEFGFIEGIAVGGSQTHTTTYNMFRNMMLNGIKYAVDIDYAIKHLGFSMGYWEKGYHKIPFANEQEMYQKMEERNGDVYFGYSNGYNADNVYNLMKAMYGFRKNKAEKHIRPHILRCKKRRDSTDYKFVALKDNKFVLTDDIKEAFWFKRYACNKIDSSMLFFEYFDIDVLNFLYEEDVNKLCA